MPSTRLGFVSSSDMHYKLHSAHPQQSESQRISQRLRSNNLPRRIFRTLCKLTAPPCSEWRLGPNPASNLLYYQRIPACAAVSTSTNPSQARLRSQKPKRLRIPV